jgi:tetratricopeptide (TPR) repeat protein
MRWLIGIAALLLLTAAGYVAALNPDPVAVRLAPDRQATWPLAGVLLGAFAAGAGVVGLGAAVHASARGVRGWRARRRARHTARRTRAVDLARERLWAGEYPETRAELERGGGRLPDDATRLALAAESYLGEGDHAAARTLLSDGIARLGDQPRLLDLLAEAAERDGDLPAAIDALERARAVDPSNPRLMRRLRDLCVASERWEDALALQGKLLAHLRCPAPLPEEERVLRGLRYQAALGEPDPGRSARRLTALGREAPDFVPAWVGAGDAYAQAGRPSLARRAWERGARRRPAAVLLERVERLDAGDGRPERTERLYRRLRRRHPHAPVVVLLHVRHLLARDRLDEAAAMLDGLRGPIADQPLVHLLRADLHRRRRDHEQAVEAYARAAGPELTPGVPFRCAHCRRTSATWQAYCPECRRWNEVRSATELVAGDT